MPRPWEARRLLAPGSLSCAGLFHIEGTLEGPLPYLSLISCPFSTPQESTSEQIKELQWPNTGHGKFSFFSWLEMCAHWTAASPPLSPESPAKVIETGQSPKESLVEVLAFHIAQPVFLLDVAEIP